MKLKTCMLASAWAISIAQMSTAAMAQSTGENAASNEIIVTAQKRSEALEDVPISITALSEDRLDQANITNFTDLGALAPGMVISATGPFFLPSIRGVTSQGIGSGNENNIATYIDGVYQPNQIGLNFDLASVKNIEILKGPQGTLFGRNATGGAILVTTRDPGKEFEGKLKFSYGRFNDRRLQGYLSVPLGENIGFNVAGLYQKGDGYMKDISGFDSAPREEINIRTKLKFTSAGGFSATLGLNYTNLDQNSSTWQYIDFPGAQLVATTRLGGINAGLTTIPYKTSYSFHPTTTSESINPTLTLDFKLGAINVKTISSYQDIKQFTLIDIDGSPLPIARQDTVHRDKVHSEEVNISSKIGDRVDWVAGLFYFRNWYFTGPNQINLGAPTESLLKSEAFAAFADATVRLTDSLFLVGGMRYSWEKKTVTLAHPFGTSAVPVTDSWNSFTPRVILRYQLADRTNIYASYSKGFKSGTIDQTGLLIQPEKIDAFELGFKTATRTLRFDASTFYYNYSNLQDSQTVQGGGGLLTSQGNVAAAKIYGAEAQIDFTPVENLNLFGGVSWLHARYKSYPQASAIVAVAIPNTPFFTWTTAPQDLKGKEMPRSPGLSLTGGFNYTVNGGGIGKFDLAGSVSYTSAQNPNRSTLNPATGAYMYRIGAYALANASVTWHSANDRFEASVFGRNIFDQQYYTVFDAFSTFGNYRQFGEPATYGVSVGVNF